PIARRQRPQVVAVAIANINLLGVEDLERSEHRPRRGGGHRRCRRQNWFGLQIQRRRTWLRCIAFASDKSKHAAVGGPRYRVLKDYRQRWRRDVANEVTVGRVQVDAKGRGLFIG